MLLENNGVRLRVTNPLDIEVHLRNGWVEIEDDEVEEVVEVDSESEGDAVEAPELDPVIDKAALALNLADPQLLSEISDEDILALDGIGKASLDKIRAEFPVASALIDEESE